MNQIKGNIVEDHLFNGKEYRAIFEPASISYPEADRIALFVKDDAGKYTKLLEREAAALPPYELAAVKQIAEMRSKNA